MALKQISLVKKKVLKTKESSIQLASASSKIKNRALGLIIKNINKNKEQILKENKKDITKAKKTISNALLKRLELNNEKLNELIKGIKDLIKLEDPVGKTLSATELDKGLNLYKVSCPIGVIGVIFESRPDALVQISCLCIKSGNAIILKGGSEAKNSNLALFKLIQQAIKKVGLPLGCTQLIETREDVKEMLKLDGYIDLVIPRGSNKFVKYIMNNTKIPVLGHSSGICHVYVDKDSNINKAIKICLDAKCQCPAVCNAMEILLVDKNIADKFIPIITNKYLKNNVEIRADQLSLSIIKKREIFKKISGVHKDKLYEQSMKNKELLKKIKKATEKDWSTEYNDLIISIKIVKDVNEAINHINRYGSKHTDAIITENKETANRFMNLVDSSSVMWNCSTRFSDGYRYGLGAEVGISTNKIHARGPVGLDGLTIYKYKLIGNGHVVKDYVGKNAKKFTHRKIFKEIGLNK